MIGRVFAGGKVTFRTVFCHLSKCRTQKTPVTITGCVFELPRFFSGSPACFTTRKEYSGAIKTRTKDGLPPGFEIIASTDSTMQVFVPLMETLTYGIGLYCIPKFTFEVYSAYMSLHRFQSIFSIPFLNEKVSFTFIVFFVYCFILTGNRFALSRYCLRLYLDREKNEYCAMFQGAFLKREKVFFKQEDVVLRNSEDWWDFGNIKLNGRHAMVYSSDFKNLRDYTLMTKRANKLGSLD